MSKVINTNYEYVLLSDTLQSTPWPAGYSPTLPTPSGISPVSTVGISAQFPYTCTGAFAVGQSFGIKNVVAISSAGTAFTLPKYSNFYVYNYGATRVCIAPTTWNVGTNGPWPVISVEPGLIATWWQSMQGSYSYTNSPGTSFTAYVTSASAPATVPSTTGNISLQLFYFVMTNSD
jgi:hypothetical protein